MGPQPVIEHGESGSTRWLKERRLRAALVIGFVESILVIASQLRWFWVVAAAVLALVVWYFVRQRFGPGTIREVAWILAASQLIAVVVPVLWELFKVAAIIALVVIAVVLLAVLLRER